MNLSQYCVSLETAKRMKELGWKQRPYEDMQYIYRIEDNTGKIEFTHAWLEFQHDYGWAGNSYTYIEAPIASEIMEELPSVLIELEEGYVPLVSLHDGSFEQCGSIIEALALLWISLKEQSLI